MDDYKQGDEIVHRNRGRGVFVENDWDRDAVVVEFEPGYPERVSRRLVRREGADR